MKMWLVGAGYWGSKLRSDLELLGVECSVIDIRDGQTVYDINTLDPVILATPLWQHHEQVLHLLSQGHDVYVEKPAAETADQVRSIRDQIRPGQLFMVGHLFQHHPQMALIQSILSRGDIGDLVHVNSRRLNWGIYQTQTDPVLSLATHDISILLALASSSHPVVTGTQCWRYSQNRKPDRVSFQGHVGTVTFDIDVSWCWPIRTRQTLLLGTQGQILWDQDTNSVQVTKNLIVDRRAINSTDRTEHSYASELSPLQHELQHWVGCVRDRRMPSTGVQQALDVAIVIDQVRQGLV